MKIIPAEEEVAIDAIPLAVKSPKIVDWKIYKEGRKSNYQIIRADGSSRAINGIRCSLGVVMGNRGGGRGQTEMKESMKSQACTNQQEYKVLNWKLYDSCGVHSLMMQHVQIYMLVEKKYPLAPLTLSMMLEKKLMIDYESEMAYQLLKFIIKQLKK
ncbi:hypothetical protein Tco_0796049 [Tanacetum coccineum]